MVVFVDLDEEDSEPPIHGHFGSFGDEAASGVVGKLDDTAEPSPAIAPFQSAATEAFGCYPIVMEIAAHIDLNTLDSLARTSRQIRNGLLQYRSMLLVSTLHCSSENVPVDPESTFRYRARAGNWYYMEDGRNYNGKSGSCARDMVMECRRCDTVVCRNCAIKPPAPIAMRERHRRLCLACAKAPIAGLAKSVLEPDTPLDSDLMQREICQCATVVWLCQPCGRSIRGADHDYQRVWKWRNQYGEVLGGLGTGIGEGDRGVVCGREAACAGAKEREQETDCDAEDARDSWSTTDGFLDVSSGESGRYERTPSPSQLGPGYERHEIEGIGGVVKTKLVRMVRVGGCVPEWADERRRKQILEREVGGLARSWCGWCWRVIPGAGDVEKD